MSKERKFPFPFTPYGIQVQFMSNLYTALDKGKVGIFESPTGTGKSLSLICGALKWLKDYQEQYARNAEEVLKLSDCGCVEKPKLPFPDMAEPDWVTNVTEEIQRQKRAVEVKAKLEKQKQLANRLYAARVRREAKASQTKRRKVEKTEKDTESNVAEDDDLMPEEYQSDGERDETLAKKTNCDVEEEEEEEEEEEVEEHVTKIFYCSRTHSQLTQFVHEVKKSPYANEIKLVALGSRQTACINEDVRALRSVTKMNEKCLDLQKARKDTAKVTKKKNEIKTNGCHFNRFHGYKDLRDHALSEVFDIEELVSIGRDLETCPYYGSRYALPQSQLVVVPYNTILHKATREAVGIQLKNNIIIVDEAHNLMETVSNIHSVELTGTQISSSYSQLSAYHDRFRSRLKARNLIYIKQLLLILEAFKSYLTVTCRLSGGRDQAAEGSRQVHLPNTWLETINDFLFNAKIDNLNLFKVQMYCDQSLIARKLNGYLNRYPQSDADRIQSTSDFLHVQGFLQALTNADQDGRVLVSRQTSQSQSSFKFLLLNPAVHFTELVQEARAIIIAGGTMQPVEELKEVLLRSSGVDASRILEFSCGHVISPDNLLALSLGKGPAGVPLDFTFQNRNNFDVIDELGRLFLNLCTVVPGGLVVFFPSYEYEETVHTRWRSTGQLDKLQTKKMIFREPRHSQQVDQILTKYSRTVKMSIKLASSTANSGKGLSGAALLSVVGGKMSEGINFADDLGRCVVVVGLPYPNMTSPELKEKLAYLDKTVGPNAGKEHYENLCMKAVNQSIGRAIRHQNDFACIVLADHRFGRPNVQRKLPSWIQDAVRVQERFGPAVGAISKFFAHHRVK